MPFHSPTYIGVSFPCGDYPVERHTTEGAHPPAVVRPIFVKLVEVYLAPCERTLVQADDGTWVVDESGHQIARVVDGADHGLVRQGLAFFGHAVAHRVVRWTVAWTHHHFRLSGSFGRLPAIEGGISALAEHMGIAVSSGSGRTALRDVLEAMALVEVDWLPGHREPLLREFRVVRGGRRVRSILRLQTARAVAPSFAISPKSDDSNSAGDLNAPPELKGRDAYRLGLPIAPPSSGRNNERGAVSMVELLLIKRLRDDAVIVIMTGGITLFRDELQSLADQSQMSLRTLLDVLASWHESQLVGLARTVLVRDVAEGPRVTITLGNSLEALFMREGGVLSLRARKNQAFGQQRRAKNKGLL